MSKEELAQQLYEEYSRAMGQADSNLWQSLPEEKKNAWLAVAEYVIMNIVL